MKLKERGYQTVMQMKVLSPENENILKDNLMRKREVSINIAEEEGEEMIALTSRIDKVVTSNPINYVINADIKGYFDTIDHKWIVKFLEQ